MIEADWFRGAEFEILLDGATKPNKPPDLDAYGDGGRYLHKEPEPQQQGDCSGTRIPAN